VEKSGLKWIKVVTLRFNPLFWVVG
jgi:hypothetical protein